MSLDLTPVHRNLHTKVTFLGLEFEDLILVLALAAVMNLVNRVANVILPVFALTQLAAMAMHMGGVVSEIYPGSTWIRKFIAAMGALMVSGIVRFAESMVTQAHGI